MGRFILNLIKLFIAVVILSLIGIAIYTLFFEPKTPQKEVTQEIELTS